MSSPLDRIASTDAPQHRAPRRAGGSSTSLSSLPSRLVAPPPPPTLKPSSPDVQLDLSSAASASTAHTHASLRTANDAPRPRSVLPSSSSPRPTTSVIESSQLWKTSAAKRAEKSWALQTERALYSDAKFKKYLALVERTLASFDSVSEWADFISFLARLHKAIQAYPAYNVVPRKLIVAKRLAQCLNPALPSGVHQRALDVYHHILSVVGPDGLRRDLHVWTSGLLPFFQYASTSVKPTLLAIYETFYLPLHDDLRPLTRALQMALLPGLEEETSEYFDRTIRLLDRISDAVEPAYFLQNLWLTLITTPSVRLAALNYLTRRMPDLTQHDDPTLLVGKDLGLMVRGLAHALDDDLLLVRRNTLDILVTHLAVDKPLFRRFVKRPDQILLVRSALHVVLRKDLSLNRRLYTWLLGADETPAAQIAFLDENALDLVRSALAQGFHGASALDTLERQKPYRIFVSLLDKWEIGQSLTRVLALDAFDAISLQVAKRQEEELVTTAKMLFEVIDPFLLYGRFFHAITQTMQSKQGSKEDGRSPLSLLCFIFKAFHIHDDETKHIHVPLLFAAVTQLLDQLLAHDQDKDGASTSQMLDALELLKLLITAMPSRVFVRIAEPGPAKKSDSSASDAPDFWQRAHRLYTSSETDSQHAARHFVGFQDAASASALVELLSHVALQYGQRAGESGERAELFVRALDVFADLMRVLDGSEAADEIALVRTEASSAPLHTHKLHWNADAWANSLLPFLQSVASFAQVERIVEVLISCCICRALDRPLVLDAPTRVDRIVVALLRYLSPAMAPYHVRAVELLWATNKVTRRSRLETALAHQLSHNDAAARAAALTAFGAYWRLSEDVSTDELRTPLLLVLDRLQASDADERQQAELWLRAHVRSYVKVVDPLVHMLVRNQPAQLAPATVDLDGISVVITHVEQPYNHELVVYALRTLAALVRFGGPGLVKALASTPLSASLSTATKQLVRAKTLDGAASYLDVVLDECVVWMRTYPAVQLEAQLAASSDTLRAAAVDAMHGLLQRTAVPPSRTDELERELIEALLVAVHRGATALDAAMREVSVAYAPAPSRPTFGAELVVAERDAQCSVLEPDVLLLVHLVERTLMLATPQSSQDGTGARTASASLGATGQSEKASGESAPGILGYVSNVFASDGGGDDKAEDGAAARRRGLAVSVSTLHGVWERCGLELSATDAKSLSLEAMNSKVRVRCRRAFERIYRAHPGETVEALLRCWQRARHDTRGAEAVVEVLAIVTPSAQILVTFLCDVLGTRMVRGDADRSRRTASSNSAGAVNDATLLLFFEQVLERMDPAEATQVWPVVIVLVKEFVASALARKVHVYPMLRILTALGEKLCLTAGMEERRTRRELQDNYAKLVDACILLSGRSLDASTWMRRSGREEDVGVEREADELACALAPEVSGVTEAINVFLATRALAALRKMQLDTDRVQTLVANAMYYIAAPAARTRSEKLQVEPHVVALLSELVRMPGTVKAWRSTVGDLFGDARFFSMGVSSATRWKPIVVALLTQDKERLADVLARVSMASTAANIFANRELEMVSRALSLRRLSFALFAGERDAFVVQLAQIQEKVVELLRTAPSEVLQAEVYLCLRVVLVRFSARHLTSFWPVLMTELMRLYDGVASEPERFEQSADARQLVLSTLKLLDMLVLLQPDDFQINEWMFITDTIDAVYPSDDFHADTLLDALAATFSRDTVASSGKAATGSQHHQSGAGAGAAANGQRRLQLGEVRTISSLGEVVAFLHSVSQNAFEAHYSDAGVDVEHVEACLLRDMFDGDDECRSGADL
ncbi:dopey and related predicted leucine zipper transcription factors [Moesziomyces antarcticus T-34]|uniref:Dopey and related predicted leucine zipper transcription factors n=1 Tax=Pseudozyma antarctica (strain T-34) TaxID=1151754 RepID=M9M5J8_PSEA3|nr:dopey and related predicted leucine zipper transcription factors [Moesziomyces antarcticus T-34]